MKTLTKSLVKRSLSVLLVLMMVFSLLTVGLTTASAAEVEIAETGAKAATIVLDTSGSTSFKTNPYIYVFENGSALNGLSWPGVQLTDDDGDGLYTYTVTFNNNYQYIVNNNNGTQTSDSPTYTGSIKVTFSGNTPTATVTGDATDVGEGLFWVDINPENGYTGPTDLDVIFPDVEGSKYILYLPSYADVKNLKFYTSEAYSGTLKVGSSSVSSEGTLKSGFAVYGMSAKYSISGPVTGDFYICQSANVSAVHTITETAVPQGTYQGYEHKDKYNSENDSNDTGSDTQFIAVIGPDGTQKNEDTVLKKIKGRGNSSWEASHKIIGKYAFNITLDKKAKLLDESAKSKKYCLVSYNADEARMRNMVVYELAQQIGVNFAPDYETVDLYNNGYYIGTYLLTDKVEIGDPLVDIVNLDEVNEMLDTDEDAGVYGTNYGLYDDDSTMTRAYEGGSSIDDTSTKGFYKYISNLEEPDESEYADSGFLLEFELNERFDDEISGFISTKGQQIVCKYPEFATKNEIKFIMDKWNTAEALMYNEDAAYEDLDAVIDVESFAKMYLIQELTKNLDGGATSYYVYYDGGKLHAGVAWDYDWTLGQYAKEYTDRVNSGSDFYDKVDADPSEEGGWYLNSKNIYGASTFNAQAALCQNDAFWGVVTAEWNEIFYSEALKFTDSTVSSVSDLDCILLDFYNTVKASTAMDEYKWGLIASDPFITNDWGSTDTGDTHDDAVVWLNNWMYNRLTWMDKYLNPDNENYPNSAPYNVDYVIQPPVVTTDKELYASGETAVLTFDDKTDGNYTYTIYKDGTQVGTTTEKSYKVTAGNTGVANYTVTATSNTSNKTSAASDVAKVEVEGFTFEIDASAPTSVTLGDTIAFEANTNSPETVTFTLYNNTTGEDVLVKTNDTGIFEVPATEVGTFTYYIFAETTVDGETHFETIDFTVEVTPFEFSVTLNAPQSVEAGLDLTLSATTNSNAAVTYTFKDGNGNILATNNNGIYKVATDNDDIDSSLTYYVEAETTVLDKVYTATSDVKTVTVTAVKDVYDVTLYFKSTSTIGYKPYVTTDGAVSDLADYEMEKDIFIGKNPSQTASYYWYKAEVQVSKASPALNVSILSSRYAMEGDISLTITESGAIYLAVDDLNAGDVMVNLTDRDETERDWCESALHMVYDEAVDGEDALAAVSANFVMRYVGDANGDGDVNIKDTTLIQKSVANIITLDDTAATVSDVTSDGFVTIKDATAIQKRIAGL